MELFEVKRKNRVFYKRYTGSDSDTIVAVFQNKEYPMEQSSLGSVYYECYVEPKELGEHLLEIFVNDEKKAEKIVRVVVVKPENVYRMIRRTE